MEKHIVRSLTIGKRVTTVRVAAKKEQLAGTTVRRMLKQKNMDIFKKVKWFLITKQIDARQKFWCGRFRKKFRRVDLACMMLVDERYIVVGE